MDLSIKKITAREILDSRGNPTVESTVVLACGATGTTAVPSGASTGTFEAVELRDKNNPRYHGKGVLEAVNNVNTYIFDILAGQDASKQEENDVTMIKLDGTKGKAAIGANAILSVSISLAKAVADAKKIPLFKHLNKNKEFVLPVPMCNVINGGAHADNNLDIQEFMIMPIGAKTFAEAIRWCSEIFHTLKDILKKKGLSVAVGDEGGFAPDLKNEEHALDLLVEATQKSGFKPGKDIVFALDAAANEWVTQDGNYFLPKSKRTFSQKELVDFWVLLSKKFPIASIEDPFGEEDFDGFAALVKKFGKRIQIVGDDLFVTNSFRLEKGIHQKSANSILIKPNQAGTLTETLQAIELANKSNFSIVISHRSGETEDTTIADLAVATGATQIKTGSVCRSERVAKYNRLLWIEEELGKDAKYAGKKAFVFK